MDEDSLIVGINILKVKILSSKREHTIKRKRKKLKRMNSIENIIKNTTSNKASNTRAVAMRRKDLAMTKTATLIDLRKLDSERNRSQRLTINMNRIKTPCSTS